MEATEDLELQEVDSGMEQPYLNEETSSKTELELAEPEKNVFSEFSVYERPSHLKFGQQIAEKGLSKTEMATAKCFLFSPLTKTPRLSVLKSSLFVLIFIFLIMCVLQQDFGLEIPLVMFALIIILLHVSLLLMLVSSIPHSLFYNIETRKEVFSRVGIGLTFVCLLNLVIFPFAFISEFLYIWNQLNDSSFGYTTILIPFVILFAITTAVGLGALFVHTSKNNLSLAGFSIYVMIIGVTFLSFVVLLGERLDSRETSNTFANIFAPIFFFDFAHMITSGVVASHVYFYGSYSKSTPFSIALLRDRIFYAVLLLLSNILVIFQVLFVLYMDYQWENLFLGVVLIPCFIFFGFCWFWSVYDTRKRQFEKVQKKLSRLWISQQQNNVLDDLQKLVNSKEFADVEFIIEQRSFYAHRNILASRSLYFYSLFAGPFMEAKSEEKIIKIEIQDNIQYPVWEALMNFLYTGRISITKELDLHLMFLADRYEVVTLSKMCEAYAFSRMNNDSVVDILLAADSCASAVDLKRETIYYIIDKVKVGELSLKDKKFENLPKHLLSEITEATIRGRKEENLNEEEKISPNNARQNNE